VIFLMKVLIISLTLVVLIFVSWPFASNYFDDQSRELLLSYSSKLEMLPKAEIDSIKSIDDLVLVTGINLPSFNPSSFGVVKGDKGLEMYYCTFPLGPCEVYSHDTKAWWFDEI
ncbi:hypothetical protein, partial [Colwellia sp. BRX8-7]|uniref:hypothetical protein n=1 Tax=Colwellia sp. BRX8-7 TaxID=2759833 RepID=UPI001C71141D